MQADNAPDHVAEVWVGVARNTAPDREERSVVPPAMSCFSFIASRDHAYNNGFSSNQIYLES